jgi:hypothetical protein
LGNELLDENMTHKASTRMWLPQLITCLLLLAAMGDNPPEFYKLLRWVVCGSFAYMAYHAHAQGKTPWAWICSAVAVVYNPLLPFYLGREAWLLVNQATIAAAVTSVFFLSSSVPQTGPPR